MPTPLSNTRRSDAPHAAAPLLSDEHTLQSEDPLGPTAKSSLQENTPEAQDEISAGNKHVKPRLTIRQLREAAQKDVLAAQATRQSQDTQPPKEPPLPKKKASLFGGLFQVREPTQVALNQVAAQIIAQHGSTSATKVPNVRMEKMPDHVPKVNTKWDGIPESIKNREKVEKARAKAFKTDPFFSDSVFRGQDRMNGRSATLSSRHSSSTSSSLGTQGYSSGSQTNSGRTRFYTHSVNSSGDLASQQRSGPPPASRPPTSASASSLPERIGEMPEDVDGATVSAQASEPSGRRSEEAGGGGSYLSTPAGNPHQEQSLVTPSLDAIPAHSISPSVVSPPRAPSPLQQGVTLTSSGPGVLEPPVTRRSGQPSLNEPFLAGEARALVATRPEKLQQQADVPLLKSGSHRKTAHSGRSAASRLQQDLENRPDSSRDRLGLRASIAFKDEDTPWESQETERPSTPKPKFHKSFGLFGKEKK